MTKSLLWQKLKSNLPSILITLFLLTVGFVYYMGLGRDALFDWDEGIYAELGRQVVLTKNIFIPSWNGAVWLEKPPGIAWLAATGIALSGHTAAGARLLMPLVAIYTLLIVYQIGKKIGSWQQGLIAAGVLASLSLFLGRTRAVNTDMALLASITTTVLFLLENRPPLWIACSVFFGVWFKGLAGFMSLIIALPLLWSKSRDFFLKLVLYLAILTIPWHLYAYLAHGNDFLQPYFFEQVLKRASSQIEFHFENRWYYFAYLYENLGIGVLLVSGLGAVLSLLRRRNLFLLWWVLAPLFIFTLAKTRLFWYILPIYPAIALFISFAICNISQAKSSKNILSILAIGVLMQGVLSTTRSVEINRVTATPPDRILVAKSLSLASQDRLAVLVPPSERLSEALLPDIAKLSSSFRYGGMPAVVYYYGGLVDFYYDVDKFKLAWQDNQYKQAMIFADDQQYLVKDYKIIVDTKTYLGIQKDKYANR